MDVDDAERYLDEFVRAAPNAVDCRITVLSMDRAYKLVCTRLPPIYSEECPSTSFLFFFKHKMAISRACL
jgi:hypothetical protein